MNAYCHAMADSEVFRTRHYSIVAELTV